METGNVMVDAQTAFARARRRRLREQAKRWLLRRPREQSRLPCLDLDSALGAVPAMSRRSAGIEAIPLTSIVGTVEPAKAQAFDRAFRPSASSRRRWERLWVAARRGAALPPISVVRVGDRYFVWEGHDRVSVANALGMGSIKAEVMELRCPDSAVGKLESDHARL
jgi:hypothetical protein